MNTKKLFHQFSSALLWNGFFYTIYKVISVSLTCALFKHISTTEFSVWAHTQSLIFIVILFLDCGFRKSIPRFSPVFAQNKNAHKKFISSLLLLEMILLFFIGIPMIQALSSFFIPPFYYSFLKSYLITLFIGEGIISLFRLLYHAHFWQKPFNMLHTGVFLIETLCNFYVLFHRSSQTEIISLLLMNKIIACGIVIFGSFSLLPYLYKNSDFTSQNTGHFLYKKTFLQFLKHSGFMWASTLIKSVTERNILFPYFTYALGTPVANTFKIAHDGALLFQRIALKTIGISDTALLAHTHVQKGTKSDFYLAFSELLKKVIVVCIPLLIIGIITAHYNALLNQNYTTYTLFLIVTIGYLCEIILSPFERVLETKQKYTLLWISYMPYIVGIIGLLYYNSFFPLSLVVSISFIHGLRLLSACLMTWYAYKKNM